MKRLAICFAVIPGWLGAIELPIVQTASGPYEVCISAASPSERDAGYTVAFRDRATLKVVSTAETIGGYTTPAVAAETSKVIWHPSGQFVAFTDRGTKHSTELYVYSLRDGKPLKLDYLDYVQNALGRVDAVEIGLHCVSTPQAWADDALTVKLYFSVDRRETGRHFYETLVTFHLDHSPKETPRLRLVSVQQPKNPNE